MNYMNYIKGSCVDGHSWRNVLFFSGCTHNCLGCFSPESHNPKNGTKITEDFITQVLSDLDKPYLDGITLSGGDFLHKRNIDSVVNLCTRIREELPEKTIWGYSGYTYEQLRNDTLRKEVLPLIDYLVDGKFVKDLYDKNLLYRGSSNQRIINVPETLDTGVITHYTNM